MENHPAGKSILENEEWESFSCKRFPYSSQEWEVDTVRSHLYNIQIPVPPSEVSGPDRDLAS